MKRPLTMLAIMAMLLAVPARGQAEEPDLAFSLVKKSFYTLIIIDTGLTFGLMSTGKYIETNPIWKPIINNHGLVLAVDWGFMIASNWALNKLHRWNKPMSYLVIGVMFLAQVYVAHHQWKLTRS